jgi:hypothetical protein
MFARFCAALLATDESETCDVKTLASGCDAATKDSYL